MEDLKGVPDINPNFIQFLPQENHGHTSRPTAALILPRNRDPLSDMTITYADAQSKTEEERLLPAYC